MRSRIDMRKLLAALLIPLVGSCSNVAQDKRSADYPSSWSKPILAVGGECPPITGVFRNHGETSDKAANYPITLDGAIFHLPYITSGAEFALLESDTSSSVLKVQLYRTSIDDADPFSVFDRSVDCQNGWLVMDQSGSGYTDGTYSESTGAVFIAVSESGDLILRSVFQVESKSMWVFRSSRKGDVWYSFPREK